MNDTEIDDLVTQLKASGFFQTWNENVLKILVGKEKK